MRSVVAVMIGATLVAVGAAVLALAATEKGGTSAGEKSKPSPGGEETDPLGANAACYVCHMTFVKEQLAKVHLAAKVACVDCHGASEKHANDENIGATKPDIVFQRKDIDGSCIKCHKRHDASAKAVLSRFIERKLPAKTTPVCTECHGTHKIEVPAQARFEQAKKR